MAGSTVCLSDLCELVAEPVDPATRHAELYLGLEHLTSGRLVPTEVGQASNVRSSKSSFQPGDVLYGKLRPYLDKAVLVDKVGMCTTELLVLRAKSGVEPRFLAAVVHSPVFVQHAIAGTTGVQHPRTSWAHIREFNMPEFTSDEQQRIADLLWAIHDAVMASEALIKSGQDLKRAAMRSLFTRGLRGEAQKETEIGPVPASWEIACVAETVRPLRFDRSQQIPRSAYASTGQWPVIDQGQEKIAAYTDDRNRLIEVDEPVIIFGDHTRIFKYVDFVFALGGDGTKPLLIQDGFVPKYLFHAFCNLEIPNRGYNRHFSVFNEMIVGKPSFDEQRKIVTILDAIDRKIDLHRRKRAVLDDLFKVLLHKLMTGEIRVGELRLPALTENQYRGAGGLIGG